MENIFPLAVPAIPPKMDLPIQRPRSSAAASARASGSAPRPPRPPPHLACSLCGRLLHHAVLTPCCAASACFDCACDHAAWAGNRCWSGLQSCRRRSDGRTAGLFPGDLIPDRRRREEAEKFLNAKPPIKKEPASNSGDEMLRENAGESSSDDKSAAAKAVKEEEASLKKRMMSKTILNIKKERSASEREASSTTASASSASTPILKIKKEKIDPEDIAAAAPAKKVKQEPPSSPDAESPRYAVPGAPPSDEEEEELRMSASDVEFEEAALEKRKKASEPPVRVKVEAPDLVDLCDEEQELGISAPSPALTDSTSSCAPTQSTSTSSISTSASPALTFLPERDLASPNATSAEAPSQPIPGTSTRGGEVEFVAAMRKCFLCHSEDHETKSCPTLTNATCRTCGIRGHLSFCCPARRKRRKRKAEMVVKQEPRDEEEEGSLRVTEEESSWIKKATEDLEMLPPPTGANNNGAEKEGIDISSGTSSSEDEGERSTARRSKRKKRREQRKKDRQIKALESKIESMLGMLEKLEERQKEEADEKKKAAPEAGPSQTTTSSSPKKKEHSSHKKSKSPDGKSERLRKDGGRKRRRSRNPSEEHGRRRRRKSRSRERRGATSSQDPNVGESPSSSSAKRVVQYLDKKLPNNLHWLPQTWREDGEQDGRRRHPSQSCPDRSEVGANSIVRRRNHAGKGNSKEQEGGAKDTRQGKKCQDVKRANAKISSSRDQIPERKSEQKYNKISPHSTKHSKPQAVASPSSPWNRHKGINDTSRSGEVNISAKPARKRITWSPNPEKKTTSLSTKQERKRITPPIQDRNRSGSHTQERKRITWSPPRRTRSSEISPPWTEAEVQPKTEEEPPSLSPPPPPRPPQPDFGDSVGPPAAKTHSDWMSFSDLVPVSLSSRNAGGVYCACARWGATRRKCFYCPTFPLAASVEHASVLPAGKEEKLITLTVAPDLEGAAGGREAVPEGTR